MPTEMPRSIETGFGGFDAPENVDLTRGRGLIRKGFEDGMNLRRKMTPSVEDALGAIAGLQVYTTKFAEDGVTDVDLAALLSTDDLKGMLPDAPLSDILKLRKHFAVAASGKPFDKDALNSPVQPTVFILPVLFKLMVKFVIEDEAHIREGHVLLIGTIILQAPKWPTNDGEMRFRINDEEVKPEHMQLRRTVQVDGVGERRVYNVAIPLDKDVIFGLTPFEVSKAAFLFEIQSEGIDYYEGGQVCTAEVRPNILINRVDERELVVIRRAEEMDKSDTYAFASLAPKLTMVYDKKKEHCPKFGMTLYIEKPVVSAFDPNTLMPIVLVAVLGTLNTFVAEEGGPDLENSIAIALTAVFVLPALATGEAVKGQSGWWMTGPIYSLFIGIILASLCNIDGAADAVDLAEAGTNTSFATFGPQEIVNWTGVGFMWFSPVILLLYILKHWLFVRDIQQDQWVEYTIPEGAKTKKNKNGNVGPGDTVKRLVGSKDASFDQWECGDTRRGDEQVNNMMSIGDIVTEVETGETTQLLQWKVGKDKHSREIYCGPGPE